MRSGSMKAGLVLGVVTLSGAASPSLGAITYVSQQRSISVSGFVNNVNQGARLDAPDFSRFNQAFNEPLREGAGIMVAAQDSSLLPERIDCEARSSITISGPVNDAFGSSLCQVTFMLTADSGYHIRQSHTSTNMSTVGIRRAAARLTGPSGVIFDWIDNFDTPNTWPVGDVTGFLAAGQYVLNIESRTQGGFAGGRGTLFSEVSLSMIVPCPTNGLICAAFLCVRSSRRVRRE